jgi:hypothetical protein
MEIRTNCGGTNASPFAQLEAARERQLRWAYDFLAVDELLSASEALRDADALSAEFRVEAEGRADA